MKAVRVLSLSLVAVLALAITGRSEEKAEKKEVTLKGTILCSKCELGETTECGTVIKVKEGDKDVIYYFIDKGKSEKYHAKICGKPAKGSVTGVVSEKDKKQFITPAKDGVKYE